MVTFLFLVAFLFFLPRSWAGAVWRWVGHTCWQRSTLKVGVEIAGKKVSSIKDEILTKRNKEGNG